MRWFRPPRLRRSPPRVTARHLFIIGPARSGTTVLQNALNDSPDIFLLGEPDLRRDTAPGFAARYNALHREWGNQETKSSFCPYILSCDGTWRDYFDALGARYLWVGAKLVINPIRPMQDLEELFDFHCREFFSAYYVFTFRDPLATVLSTRDLQLLSRGETDGLRAIMRNFVDCVGLYVRMLRNLPHVRAVFHESLDAATFEDLQGWLEITSGRASTYYDTRRVRSYDVLQLTEDERASMAVIQQLYADLREGVLSGFATPQLEQNDRHLSPQHHTLLGSIDRRARLLSKHFSD